MPFLGNVFLVLYSHKNFPLEKQTNFLIETFFALFFFGCMVFDFVCFCSKIARK